MAIYLDANVLWPWRTFAEPERLALSIVADQLGQEIIVPWVAAEEGAAHHRRSLEAAVAHIDRAESALSRAFNSNFSIDPDPWPDVDQDVQRWRAALDQLGTVLPLADEIAREALRREIYGIPPARRPDKSSGVGSRDAAIWLSVVADHLRRREPGHFISANSRDFAHNDRLRPELAAEIDSEQAPLTLHVGIEPFLKQLGTVKDDASIGLEVLAEWAAPAVMNGLADSLAVVRAVSIRWVPDVWIGARVQTATPVEVTRVRRYERDQEAVTTVDARWQLIAELHIKKTGTWDTVRVVDGLGLEGSVQVYLPEDAGVRGEAALIGAQLTSRYDLDLSEDGSGTLWTWTTITE
jgi:hypothetical protein